MNDLFNSIHARITKIPMYFEIPQGHYNDRDFYFCSKYFFVCFFQLFVLDKAFDEKCILSKGNQSF